jgi:hypothetical protein
LLLPDASQGVKKQGRISWTVARAHKSQLNDFLSSRLCVR